MRRGSSSSPIARGSGPAAIALLLAACGLVACSDDAAEEPMSAPMTTGGEEAPEPAADAETPRAAEAEAHDPRDPWSRVVGEEGAIVPTRVEGGESQWGRTRSEQCRPPERPPISERAKEAIAEGVAAARNGDVEAARARFEAALRIDPRAYPAAFNLGALADGRGDANRAIRLYQQALRIAPDYEEAVRGLVRLRLRRDDARGAVSIVQPLAEAHPTNLHLQAILAEVLVEAGRVDAAWGAARRALSCDERFVPALVALHRASMQRGRRELAEAILEQALEVSDTYAELHFLRGRMLLEDSGRVREAVAALRRAVELDPGHTRARTALGLQLLAGGNYEAAVGHLEAAARQAPRLTATHLNLADAYRASRRWQEARREFDAALSMQSELPEAHFDLGLMYFEAGESMPGLDELGALRKAVEELETYRRMSPPESPGRTTAEEQSVPPEDASEGGGDEEPDEVPTEEVEFFD